MIAKFQSSYPVYITNQGNSLFFSITGLLLGIYMANMKISGIYNTYMNAIIGFTSLAQDHIDDKHQVADYLDKIMTSSQHLLSLINGVLDMSRIESGKITIENSPMCITELLHDIQTITQPEIDARHLDFSIDTHNLVNETFLADHLRLQQVLLNILSNSIKFTSPGGKIDFSISQLTSAPSGYADYEFRIKDNGIGMNPEFKKHIFEAFTRENTSTVSGIQGTELGMSITKNIIDMMGGTIVVNSEEGKGSEFIVSLRFSTNIDLLTRKESESFKNTELSVKKILLVEDNPLNEEIARTILTDHGFIIDSAFNGMEAVDKIKDPHSNDYDLILMDIQMPGMDGYETTQMIRKLHDPHLANIPIIAMTANAFEEDRKAALNAGMNGHLAKPVDIDHLLDIIRQI